MRNASNNPPNPPRDSVAEPPYGKLRLAFIGGHGHHYLRGAITDDRLTVEAVGVAGDGRDNETTRQRFANVLDQHAGQWFDDPIEMLDRFAPSAVSIGGVYAHNTPLIVEAIKRGIPVAADKPVAAGWKALEQLRAAIQAVDAPARGSTRKATVVTEFDFRSRPEFRAARATVEAGEIGEVVLATAQKSYRFGMNRPEFYRRREDYGSTMLWVASHAIDGIAFVTGRSFVRAAGAHGNLSKPDYGEMEDHCAVLLTMDNHATALVHADFLRPAAAATHGDDRMRIAGSSGILEVRGGRCLLTTTDHAELDITGEAQPKPMHIELLDALLAGDSRWYSTRQSLETATVLLAARDAADQQRFVEI